MASLSQRLRSNARLFRFFMNLHPAIRASGGTTTYIAPDFSEMRVKLRLKRITRNYVGTIFGGSMYASVDPHYMIMLIHRLGPDYLVWDKSASIRFKKPGRQTLYATFRVPDDEVETIKRLLKLDPKIDRTYAVELVDKNGVVHAVIDKVVQVRRKDARQTTPASG